MDSTRRRWRRRHSTDTHRDIFVNDTRNSDFFMGPTSNAQLQQDAERMQPASESSSLGFMYRVQFLKKPGNLKRHPDNRKCDELAKQITQVNFVQRHPVLEGC